MSNFFLRLQVLQRHSEDVGVDFTASAMDIPSANFLLRELKVPFLKVGSGDSNNVEFFRHLSNEISPECR